jgi:hypothetical protein
MKRTSWMIAFALTCFQFAGYAHAEPTHAGPSIWQGSGMVFGKDGRETTGFTIELRRTAVDERSTETKGTVVLGNGGTIPVYQRMTESDKGAGFRLDTNRGKGGGYCLGAGLCESYEDAGNGQAFATTTVVDGPDKLRLLVIELDHGQAVRYISQTLTRKS